MDGKSEFLAAMQEAADILAGKMAPARAWHPPASVDVRAIRRKTGLSQPKFAEKFGFGLAALRDWEQGRRRPEMSARVLLIVIDRHPEAVTDALAHAAA